MYHSLLSLLKKHKISLFSCSRIEIKMKDQQMKQSFASCASPFLLSLYLVKEKAKGISVFILPVKVMSLLHISVNLGKMLSTPVSRENCNVSSILFYILLPDWLCPPFSLQKLHCSQPARYFVLLTCLFFMSVILSAMPQ